LIVVFVSVLWLIWVHLEPTPICLGLKNLVVVVVLFCSAEKVATLSESHDLCINGDCFEMLQRTHAVIHVIPYVKVCVNTY
jgi:hypothetical protein